MDDRKKYIFNGDKNKCRNYSEQEVSCSFGGVVRHRVVDPDGIKQWRIEGNCKISNLLWPHYDIDDVEIPIPIRPS